MYGLGFYFGGICSSTMLERPVSVMPIVYGTKKSEPVKRFWTPTFVCAIFVAVILYSWFLYEMQMT